METRFCADCKYFSIPSLSNPLYGKCVRIKSDYIKKPEL